ncbi:uncharacterized protein si:dkey-249d8.1 [Rhinichthys klamathensis goyatoka]|uniref:uncharacterized protein si:dkey-249d8.1 n=1 Tax=Rhinichthys klamathensis goyatoka TaxID=3034132 RepID=UPI0024B5A06F|nr:uncharacterized protein si:dkey-249d8.1 [Rhinichthys klamathensis goyatoka]
MAEQSPSKKLRNQVKGFLCEVSPIKDIKKPYFDAILQHEGEVSKVVAFRPEDHIHFQNAETTRSQVTLDDVVLQPYVESSRKRNVFYTHSSKMSCVHERGETSKNSLSATPQCVQLSELQNLDTKSKKVNINAKIIQEVRKGNSVVWDGRYLPRTEYTVADTTGYISLTVWCEHNITVGEWYNITNVSVGNFKGKISLSTTKNTQILNIASQGTAVAVQVPTETIKCDIIGVNIKNIFICPRSHTLKDVTPSSPTVYCVSCNTHYKPPAIIMRISGHLGLKPEMGNVVEASIEDEVIRSVLTVKPGASREDIIQSFIALPPMQITIRENIVVKMEDVPQKAEIRSEAELPVKVEPVEESIDFYSPPDHGILFSSQDRKRKSTD